MTIEKQTVPCCLNVVWDENGKLKAPRSTNRTSSATMASSSVSNRGDAQPVSCSITKGVDVAGIIGRIGQDAIALAESNTYELRAALATCSPHRRADGFSLASPRLMPKSNAAGRNRGVESAETHSARATAALLDRHAASWSTQLDAIAPRCQQAGARGSRAARHALTRAITRSSQWCSRRSAGRMEVDTAGRFGVNGRHRWWGRHNVGQQIWMALAGTTWDGGATTGDSNTNVLGWRFADRRPDKRRHPVSASQTSERRNRP